MPYDDDLDIDERQGNDLDDDDNKDNDNTPEGGEEDKVAVDPNKKVYTPDEVQELIRQASDKAAKAVTKKERSAAEKKIAGIVSQYGDYEDLKGLSAALAKYGYTGDTKVQREAIEALVSESTKEKELEELQEEAEKNGTTPEMLYKIKQLEKEVDALHNEKKQAIKRAEQEQKVKQDFENQMKELEKSYPGITYNKLMNNPKFVEFEKDLDRRLTWKQVYEKFIKVYGEAEAETMKKIKSNMSRSTSSGKDRGQVDGTHGLTDDEIDFIDDHNRKNPKMKITYKEFAERKKMRM